MKMKIFIAAGLLAKSMLVLAQNEQKIETSNSYMKVVFSISSSPKFKFGEDKLTFCNDTNNVNFPANERLVIRLESTRQENTNDRKLGDINGDSKVDISDITTLVDIVLGKNTQNFTKARTQEKFE